MVELVDPLITIITKTLWKHMKQAETTQDHDNSEVFYK